MKVLVVEDDPVEVQRITSIIKSAGHLMLCTGNGEQAYQTALSERPDVAIIKTILPDMRGMELFYRIRIHPALREMIVILSNPLPAEDEVLEGFCLYSDFHWQWPLDEADLRKVLELLAQNEA